MAYAGVGKLGGAIMDAVSGVAAGQSSFQSARAALGAGSVTVFNLVSDQSSAQFATATVGQATQQLASDQAPRGSPSTIVADHQAVRTAQEDVQKAQAQLQQDRSQTSLVNVLA
jgi:hypothetical protein